MLIYNLIPEQKCTIKMLHMENSWADFSWPDPTKLTEAVVLFTSIYLVSYLHSALTMQMGEHQRSSNIGPTYFWSQINANQSINIIPLCHLRPPAIVSDEAIAFFCHCYYCHVVGRCHSLRRFHTASRASKQTDTHVSITT